VKTKPLVEIFKEKEVAGTNIKIIKNKSGVLVEMLWKTAHQMRKSRDVHCNNIKNNSIKGGAFFVRS
jgi:hypothetical protein